MTALSQDVTHVSTYVCPFLVRNTLTTLDTTHYDTAWEIWSSYYIPMVHASDFAPD